MPNINPQEHLTSDLFGSTVTSGTSSGFSSLIAATPGPEILYFGKNTGCPRSKVSKRKGYISGRKHF